RSPQNALDWTHFHLRDNTVGSDVVVGMKIVTGVRSGPDGKSTPIPIEKKPPGEFTGRFRLSEIERPVGGKKAFQLGLCLGAKNGKQIPWATDQPVLPQSLTKVEIAGPESLSETMRLINGCPTPLGWDYDPAAAVRAANHLRGLGTEKAVAALREF